MTRKHWLVLSVIAVVSLIAQLSVKERHHWWDAIPAFYAAYGFVGCIVIVIVSKWFGKKIAFRDEDYYDR
jgi:hypothetical protein